MKFEKIAALMILAPLSLPYLSCREEDDSPANEEEFSCNYVQGCHVASCQEGWAGECCNTCAPGYFGNNCSKCDCAEGRICDDGLNGTGRCLCENGTTDTLTDTRDGHSYQLICINGLFWTAENINYEITPQNDSNDIPYYLCPNGNDCYYSNKEKYGLLYTEEGAYKACPAGSRLPSANDVEELLNYVSKNRTSESDFEALISTSYVFLDNNYFYSHYYPHPKINPTDEFGFGALSAGGCFADRFTVKSRYENDEDEEPKEFKEYECIFFNENAYFWTLTDGAQFWFGQDFLTGIADDYESGFELKYPEAFLTHPRGAAEWQAASFSHWAISVRCVVD